MGMGFTAAVSVPLSFLSSSSSSSSSWASHNFFVPFLCTPHFIPLLPRSLPSSTFDGQSRTEEPRLLIARTQCLAVEEVARIDPSVAVMIDIQNTLLITAFMRYGTPEQKTKYLTRLCADTVCRFHVIPPSPHPRHRIFPVLPCIPRLTSV